MAIRSLGQIYCSLNLGLIYSFDYSWSPQGGVEISIFFVKENGNYTRPPYLQQAQIQIGNSSFSMIVVASDIQLSSGRRVMEVKFLDETYKLDNFQVVLTGKGCGYNVYPLGTPVDGRSSAQKQASAIDPAAQQIAEFTQFSDIEYSFDDFLDVLRQKFNVQVSAFYDASLTAPYMGSFREVLNAWCNLYNLSWFIENGILKVFDPTSVFINFPTQPINAITYSDSEDVRDTYSKTCYNWFQQEGGQFQLNQTSDDNGALLVRTDTLYPVGAQTNIPQYMPDLNQVAAAQFGQPFWFLYNYYKGTTAQECGWTVVSSNPNLSVFTTASTIGIGIAQFNNTVYQNKFESYKTYGEQIAGKYYLSNQKSTIATDRNYTWFDETQGQITSFTNVDGKSMNLEFLTPTNGGINAVAGTFINEFYSGVNYMGDRIVYRDDVNNATSFNLSDSLAGLVNSTYQTIFDTPGSEAVDFSQLTSLAGTQNVYMGYGNVSPSSLPSELRSMFDDIAAYTTGFEPRFDLVPIKGITTFDYNSLKATQTEQPGIELIVGNEGGSVVTNTAVIKTREQGSYNVYYNKYEQCASSHSAGNYFGHRFEPRQISSDNQFGITFQKTSSNVYRLNRDYSVINALVNNPLLSQLAQPRSFLTRRVSYTLNYFETTPTQFLTNGLVGLSVSVGDNGVTASYSYSNEVLAVPYPENRFAEFEQQIRNSWIRRYQPTQTIS